MRTLVIGGTQCRRYAPEMLFYPITPPNVGHSKAWPQGWICTPMYLLYVIFYYRYCVKHICLDTP